MRDPGGGSSTRRPILSRMFAHHSPPLPLGSPKALRPITLPSPICPGLPRLSRVRPLWTSPWPAPFPNPRPVTAPEPRLASQARRSPALRRNSAVGSRAALGADCRQLPPPAPPPASPRPQSPPHGGSSRAVNISVGSLPWRHAPPRGPALLEPISGRLTCGLHPEVPPPRGSPAGWLTLLGGHGTCTRLPRLRMNSLIVSSLWDPRKWFLHRQDL